MEEYLKNIGKKCTKKGVTNKGVTHEPKPFKSGLKTNTIKGVIPHPQLEGQMAYTFEEDESYVETRRCAILSKKDLDN